MASDRALPRNTRAASAAAAAVANANLPAALVSAANEQPALDELTSQPVALPLQRLLPADAAGTAVSQQPPDGSCCAERCDLSKPAAAAATDLAIGGLSVVRRRSSPSNANSPQEGKAAPHNWQATKLFVRDRLSFVLCSETLADVHFVVGQERSGRSRFPAHKLLLSIGSAVFDAMFNGPMACKDAEVVVPDVEPAAFLALLRFLYTDEVDLDSETVMSTLYTAKKYAVPALESACVEFLKANVCSENAFSLLTQARMFDEPHLAKLCLDVIDTSTSEALLAEGFTEIDLDTLCAVLERDTLGIRESKLFEAVKKWSEVECGRRALAATPENRRAVLGGALQLVRFPLMTVEEFASQVAHSKLLSDRELVELFCHFIINPKPSVSFSDTPRCCVVGKEHVVSRFCQIEHRWGYSGTSDKIKFIVNKKIYVIGFGLYGSVHGPAEYAVTLQVLNHDSQKPVAQTETTLTCDGSSTTFRVLFREPVEIQQNIHYVAAVTMKGPDSYYGTKGLRKVTHDAQASGKVTFQFSYAAGNNNGTSVEDGQIPEIIFYI